MTGTDTPLAGRSAIVTGGAGGIGSRIAVSLAREGASVVVTDLDSQLGQRVVERIDDIGGRAQFIHGDISDETDVREIVAETARAFGGPHILVNNAVNTTQAPADSMDTEKFHTSLDTNLVGPYLLARESIPHMRDDGYGRILNIGAIQAHSPLAGSVAYASGKAGLEGLTRSLAAEWSSPSITVNTVKVGVIYTGHWTSNESPPDGPIDEWYEDPPGDLDTAAATLVDRMGRPSDVAALIAFLAGPQSGFITGTTLRIDGGRLYSRKPEPLDSVPGE